MEIPRALLEHYLRATGQEREGLFHVALYVTAGRTDVLAFRLGLCAAAEDGLAAAAELTRSGRTAEVMVLATQADRLLRKAGVEPAAWERARQP